MQQLFLSSSAATVMPPPASGSAMTIPGPSGTKDIAWIFLLWCPLSYDS